MLPAPILERAGLLVAVLAADPVRRADLAARVALSGHTLAENETEADVVLADGEALTPPEQPALRLQESGEEGTSLPPNLSPAQLDVALRAVAVGLRVSLPVRRRVR